MARGFSYDIKRHIATLSEHGEDGRYTLEVNYISYGGHPAKLDIRRWDKKTNEMRKGLVLDEEEAKALISVLKDLRNENAQR